MSLFIQSSTVSHVGNIRELNEDAYYVSEAEGVWCLADGMGGYEAGEVASAMVVDAVAAACGAQSIEANLQSIDSAMQQVNLHMQRSDGSEQSSIMGSTVLVVLAMDNQCACLWAGDSRLYLYRDHLLYQMSKDHSLVQELADQGIIKEEEMQHHPKSHVITRAVGAHPELELERIYFDLLPSDQLLMCSDGLYNELSLEDIIQVLGSDQSVNEKAQSLLNQVLIGQAKDNVTVTVIEMAG